MTKLFKPKINTPAAAASPNTPDTELAQRKLGGDDERNLQNRRRRGRASLRIDPQNGGSGLLAGASGVNLPQK